MTCIDLLHEAAAEITRLRGGDGGDGADLRMRQLVIAPFTTETGSTYSVFALGEDGAVYRYDPGCEGWLPWPMKVATCKDKHKGKR